MFAPGGALFSPTAVAGRDRLVKQVVRVPLHAGLCLPRRQLVVAQLGLLLSAQHQTHEERKREPWHLRQCPLCCDGGDGGGGSIYHCVEELLT